MSSSRASLCRAAERIIVSHPATLADAIHRAGETTRSPRLRDLALRLGRDRLNRRALALLERAMRLPPGPDEAVLWSARCLYDRGHYQECIDRIREHHDDDSLSWAGCDYFWSLHRLGRTHEALAEIDRVRASNPDGAGLLLAFRAGILREQDRTREASTDERASAEAYGQRTRRNRIQGIVVLVLAVVLIEWLAASRLEVLWTLRGLLAALLLAGPIVSFRKRRRAARRLQRLARSRTVRGLPAAERDAVLRELKAVTGT